MQDKACVEFKPFRLALNDESLWREGELTEPNAQGVCSLAAAGEPRRSTRDAREPL